MWFLTDPEELRNYEYKASLKKAKMDLIKRNESLGGTGPYRQSPVLRNGLWYTGISSAPLSSLATHKVDTSQSNRFVGWVIPTKFSHELKNAVLSQNLFQHITDDSSDYIARKLPYTYLYNLLDEKKHVLSIDPVGFSPMRYFPGRPAQVFVWHANGSCTSWDIETKNRDSYPEVIANLLEKAQTGETIRLLLRSQGATIMQCDFGNGNWGLYYDARTSQSSYVYLYLPEDDQKSNWVELHSILLDFLRCYKKKRGTKWKYIRKALASDNMRFQNGLIYHN